MKIPFLLFLLPFLTTSLVAGIQTRTVEYAVGGKVMQGYLAFDDSLTNGGKKIPGIVVVHEWNGLGAYVKGRVEQLAALGYAAFGVDIYGKGVRATNMQGSARLAASYLSNRALLRERCKAGLERLKKYGFIDQKRIAAIGYCFGGTTVLELARSGAEIAGFVTFHAGLDNPRPEDDANIKAPVLVLHGADDPFNPPLKVMAFQDEMRKAKVDWQMISYGGAVHGFSNPMNGGDPSKGLAYNKKADLRSWKAMKQFFDEIFQ